MRTTLTLDDDVAARVEQVRRRSDRSAKDVINSALRAGLDAMETPADRGSYSTAAHDLGDCLIGSIDDVASALDAGQERPLR